MLEAAYGKQALGRTQWNESLIKFKSSNFHLRNGERGRPAKKFEDYELKALHDERDGQTQEELAEQLHGKESTIARSLKVIGEILKVERWVPYELTERQKEIKKALVKFCSIDLKESHFASNSY